MTLSDFTGLTEIRSGELATPALFNGRYSTLSRNLDQLNADASSVSASAETALQRVSDLSSDVTDLRSDVTASNASIDALQSGKADTGHTHAASDVTSGTFADARISASAVTQHQGQIDHDALTNVSAAEHIDWTADSGSTIADGNLSADVPRSNEEETISSAWTHSAGLFFSDAADVANSAQAARPIIHHGSGSASAVGIDGALHTEDV